MNTQITENVRVKKVSQDVYIFLLCFSILLRIISSSTLTKFLFINKNLWNSILIKLIIFGCITIFLLNRLYSKKKIIITVGLLGITVIISIASRNMAFLQVFLFILAYPKNINTRLIAKWQSYTFNLTTIFVVFINKIGIINSIIDFRDGKIRDSCGFTSANGFANTVLLSLIIFMYYKQDKWKLRNSIFWFFITIYVYNSTNSRMAFILELIVLTILTFRLFKIKYIRSVIYILSQYSFIIGLIFSLIITIFYTNGYFMTTLRLLNEFLTYRLSYMSKYFIDPGISLFGNNLIMISKIQSLSTGERWSGLDNSYMYMLISWGIIGILIFTIFIYKLGKHIKKTRNYYAALYMFIMSLIGITENFLAIVPFNFTIILIAHMISESRIRRVK